MLSWQGGQNHNCHTKILLKLMLIQMLMGFFCLQFATIKLKFWGLTIKHCHKIWKTLTGNIAK